MVEFSVTHAEDLALIAVSACGRVGIDAEKLQPFPELDLVAATAHAAQGRDPLRELSPRARQFSFYQSWTRMEALFKAAGAATPDTSSPAASDCKCPSVRSLRSPADCACVGDWLLFSFEAAPGYLATLATASTTREVLVRDFAG